MTKEEATSCVAQYVAQYDDTIASCFTFEYDDAGNVSTIHLASEHLRHYFYCTYEGIDVLHTPATALVAHLDAIASYVRDEDATQGYMYKFPSLNLSFWRGNVCREEDLESERFLQFAPAIQQDEKRFLYFEVVTFYAAI